MILKTSCFLTGPGDTGPNYNVIGDLKVKKMTPRELAFFVKKFVKETTKDVPESDVSEDKPLIRVIRIDGKPYENKDKNKS